MNGAPKDNANPVIKSIEKQPTRFNRKEPIGWADLRRISADPITCISIDDPSSWTSQAFSQPFIERSPEDIAVMHALADVAAISGGSSVSLLTKAGIVIPTSKKFADQPSLNIFHATETQQAEETKVDGKVARDTLESDEVFDIIRNIQDPEHPLTLEQLGVVSREQIDVDDTLDLPTDLRSQKPFSSVQVRFTPTVPHCSMATLIGLAIEVKLHRSLPKRFKVKVSVEPGSHQSELAVNKQLQDKERVRAALENPHLLKIVNKCISEGMTAAAI